MSNVRLILLSMLAVFAASAIASASAVAANGCEEVGGEKCLATLNGAPLLAGETREVTPIWNSTFTLTGTVGGATVMLTSKLVDVKEAIISGGIPGTGSGRILAKNVEVVKPKECKITNKEIITEPLKGELVELVKRGVPQKVDDVLVEPKEGTVFFKIKFENNPKCPINGVEANEEGSDQAEPSPRKTETKLITVKFQGNEKWEFRRHGSPTVEKSELKLGGKPVTLTGTVDVGLVGGGTFGTD